MGWQTASVVQLIAGNTIINASGSFTYSGPPAAGNLIASVTPASGVDSFGNNYLSSVANYSASFASQLGTGFIIFYHGSLASGWSQTAIIETDALGDLLLLPSAGREVTTTNNIVDDGSGNASVSGNLTVSTINGSANTGSGNNGGVTSGPSGTTNAFPAAGPNHTHAEIHQHPI